MKTALHLFLGLISPFLAAAQFSSNLPLVQINTNGQNIPYGQRISAQLYITANRNGQPNSLNQLPTEYAGKISIAVRGASSSSYPQPSYAISTLNPDSSERNVSLLDMPAEHDWLLITNWNDKSFARNILSQHLFAQMGHYAPKMRLCEVLLNGDYVGVYLFAEKIKRDRNRVNIAKLRPQDISGLDVSGGYILKNDIYDGSNGWLSNYQPIGLTNYPIYPLYEYPSANNIQPAQAAYIQAFIDSMETALYSANFSDPQAGYQQYMDLGSFVDYFILNELSRNVDGFKKSSYYHKNRADIDNKLHAGPVWDFDWAWKNIYDCPEFGHTDGSGWAHRIVDCGYYTGSFGWYKRLLQDSSFGNEVQCRWQELRQTILDTNYLFERIEEVAEQLTDPQDRHFALYQTLGYHNGCPEVDAPANSYPEELRRLKDWIATRIGWLDQNMPGLCSQAVATELVSPQTPFRAFPNPIQRGQSLQIQGLDPNHSLQIWDILAQPCGSYQINNQQFSLTINLPAGLYLLQNGEQKQIMQVF